MTIELAMVRAWERRQRRARRAVVSAVAIAARPPVDPHPNWVRDRLADDIDDSRGGDAAV